MLYKVNRSEIMDKIIKQNSSKCVTCQFYNKKNDSCTLSKKEKCSITDFSKCTDYLVSDKLIHY